MDMQKKLKKDDENSGIASLPELLASKHALASLVAFLGAGWLLLVKPDSGTMKAALLPYAPAVMSLTGSFLAGLIIGRIARRNLKPVLISGGVLVVAITLLTQFGVIGPSADQWMQSSTAWVNVQLNTMQSYIAALLPSATAASSGLYLGFRRKRKPR